MIPLINAIEALRLRQYRKTTKNNTVTDLAKAFCAVPAKGCTNELQDMLVTIFEAGRIQGIREERLKNKVSCHK